MAAVCEVGILFADIAGSTRIYERLGDARAHAVINQCFKIMGECVQAHRGVVVKTIGDELMAAFSAAHQPFSCAIDIRRRFDEMPPLALSDGSMRVAVRIGFHFGSAMRAQEDFFGDTVNIAARMVALAKANQILTTGDVMDILPDSQKAMGMEFGQIEVRGRAAPVRIAQIPLDAPQQHATVLRFGETAEAASYGPEIKIVFEAREWTVPAKTRTIVFGRDPASDIILKSPHVSRSHATIERRRDKIILVDHSTNGTSLIIGRQRPIILLREEFSLVENGRIAFGKADAAEADIVDFYIS
jgi:class 3 adenylate cyclase